MIPEIILDQILVIEGGLSDDPDDKGGATNFGISLRFARSIGLDLDGDGDTDKDDIIRITDPIARSIFIQHFFYVNSIHKLPMQIQYQAFDISINSGPSRAGVLIQEMINRLGHGPIEVDGKIGPITLRKINRLAEINKNLAMALADERDEWYARICFNDHSQIKYLRGWLRRSRKWRYG